MSTDQIIVNDFIQKHPYAVAKKLEMLLPEEVSKYLSTCTTQNCLKIFSYLQPKYSADCFLLLPAKQQKVLLESGDAATMAAMLKFIDGSQQSSLTSNMSSNKFNLLRQALDFKPNTIGSLAKPAVTVTKDLTVVQVIAILKRNPTLKNTDVFVVDFDGLFQGIVTMKGLLLSEENNIMSTLIDTTCPRFSADQSIKYVLKDKAWFTYHNIAVIDSSERFIGTISYKSLLDVW